MKCPRCGSINREKAAFCNGCGQRLVGSDSATLKPTQEKAFPAGHSKETTPVAIQGGRYTIEQVIGSGGMGRVYLACDNRMKCTVVVKEMFPRVAFPEEMKYLTKRFEEEARLLFRLKHPRLPKVTDFFTEGNKMYMIMEYIEGRNLKEVVKNKPKYQISVEECIDWMAQVLDILQYLHGQNPPIIHRDIKPPNLMLSPIGEIFLVDFGVARTVGEMTQVGTQVGTFGFASPEHFSGKFVLSSDIYSLGATFHYLLSGENPQERDPFDYPPLSKYRDDVPVELQQIIQKMLSRDRKGRYEKVGEVIEDLRKLRASLAKSIKPIQTDQLTQPIRPVPSIHPMQQSPPVQSTQQIQQTPSQTMTQGTTTPHPMLPVQKIQPSQPITPVPSSQMQERACPESTGKITKMEEEKIIDPTDFKETIVEPKEGPLPPRFVSPRKMSPPSPQQKPTVTRKLGEKQTLKPANLISIVTILVAMTIVLSIVLGPKIFHSRIMVESPSVTTTIEPIPNSSVLPSLESSPTTQGFFDFEPSPNAVGETDSPTPQATGALAETLQKGENYRKKIIMRLPKGDTGKLALKWLERLKGE